jgi:acyl-homoserine-lactone acylase
LKTVARLIGLEGFMTRLFRFLSPVVGLALLAAVTLCLVRFLGEQQERARQIADAQSASDAYAVQINRDEFGVPRIHGAKDADVAFGLGYAHAEDDWATIQDTLVAARGTLASHYGADAAVTDYIVRLLRIRELVDDQYAEQLSPAVRLIVEAYADGLNLYRSEHPAQVWWDEAPVTGQDIVAGFVLRTPFMYGLDADIGELFEDERQHVISLGEGETAFQLIEGMRLPLGSNAIAIAPERSDDGATRLLINSHQPFEGPVAWYEARLHSDEGWDMVGATFPGAPLILHGHNPDLGWAHTVNHPDLADIYVLETDGDRYQLDGEWRDLEHATARINVKIWGPISWTVSRDLWWSLHGPVIRAAHGDYAIRYSGMDQIGQVQQWYEMNRATSLDDWMTAMERNAIPSLNAVYADQAGHIAYIYNARMPVRLEGFDWTEYVPGNRSDLIWQTYHPLSEMPIYIDPASGWLLSANQTPFDATDLGSNLDSMDFSQTFGIQPRMSNRAWRGLALMREDTQTSRERLERIKFDKDYSPHSAVGRLVAEILALDLSGDTQLMEAQAVLAQWDLSTDTPNRRAALGVLTAIRCVGNLHTNDPWLMDPRQALNEAADELMHHYGRLDPEWGDVNRMVRGDVDLPVGGGPDIMRAIYAPQNSLGIDGRIHAAAGDTSIMLVEWHADGTQTSDAIHQFGTATLDSASPHYADQVPLFVGELWRSLDLSPIEGGYSPGEAH